MTKRLYRSRTNKVVGGVCGGIAEHLEIDPVLARLVFILLTFATGLGPGIIIYLIAMVVIPEAPLITPSTPEPTVSSDETAAV